MMSFHVSTDVEIMIGTPHTNRWNVQGHLACAFEYVSHIANTVLSIDHIPKAVVHPDQSEFDADSLYDFPSSTAELLVVQLAIVHQSVIDLLQKD